MRIEKVYELLEVVKRKDDNTNRYVNRLLKYIYQDVYIKCFDELMEKEASIVINDGAQVGSIRYDNVTRPYVEAKKNISVYLDEDESIVTYLLEMVKDGKDEFINYFFDKIKIYLDIVDNHFYTTEDFRIFSFSFNMYCMLKAYHEHKDNFELFSKIVDDSSVLVNFGKVDSKYLNSFTKIKERKILLDAFIENSAYDRCEKVPSLFKEVLTGIGLSYLMYDTESLENKLSTLNQIVLDYDEVSSVVGKDKLISFDEVVERCVLNKYNSKAYPYYAANLLVGDRLDFVNKHLKVLFENDVYRKDAFEKISLIDYHLFNYLNNLEGKVEDSFIQSLNRVFDSETYFEFNSKVECLINASNLFKEGNIGDSLREVKSLDSLKHKKHIHGTLVSSNSINKTNNSEESIFVRMVRLYDEYYKNADVRVGFIMREVFKSSDLEELDSEIDKRFKEKLLVLKQLEKLKKEDKVKFVKS